MRLFAISMVAMGLSSVILSLVVTTAVLAPDRQETHSAILQWQTTVERN